MLRERLSYANVTASLALFVALAGTATAAVMLPRDSVGAREVRADAVRSPEIAKDAVRSPEIVKDAVRSPEIRAEAVRTSELEDGGIKLEDIADGARSALEGAEGPRGPDGPPGPSGTSTVHITEVDSVLVPTCDEFDATNCRVLGSVAPGVSDALVQAKFSIFGTFSLSSSCALVQGILELTKLDEARSLGIGTDFGNHEVSLMAVAGPIGTVSVRCTDDADSSLTVRDLKLTAVPVDTVIGG